MYPHVNDKTVLVTGAGGWLGGEIAARLTAAGAQVTALLRRPGLVLGNDGDAIPVARTMLGDIAAPHLGWDPLMWRTEARAHELIVHCAALTRFDADPARAHAVNVGGTREIVEFATAGRARLLHVSTAYVNGTRDGDVWETTPVDGSFNNIYERTKALAEDVVRQSGVPAVIVRPSIVLGDLRTGRVRTFGTFYFLLKAFAEGWVTRMPAEPWATLNLVPIDHVVDGIVALISGFEKAAGKTFHLTADQPTPMSAFAETLSQFPGLVAPEFVSPAAFVPPAGAAFRRLIAPYAPYFRRNPRFIDDNFLSVTGMACDMIDSEWWERLVAFALEAGFLGAAQASRSGPNGMANEAPTPSSAGSR